MWLSKHKLTILSSVMLMAVLVPNFYFAVPQVNAEELDQRSLQIQNSAPGVITNYTTSFIMNDDEHLGSINILVCSNSPLQGDVCNIPAGFDLTNAKLSSQTGPEDFTLYNVATNEVLLSRTPANVIAPVRMSFTFSNVVNPNSIGSYYVRISTYNFDNGTGNALDFGGLAFSITNNLELNTIVLPYLTFCSALTFTGYDCESSSGDFIDFGGLSTNHSSQGSSQLIVSTNAVGGYIVQVYGTTMTSGNNIIDGLNNETASKPGTSQFGINLRSNTQPYVGSDPVGPGYGQPTSSYNQPNLYHFNSGDIIASSVNPDNSRKYTVSYLVNVSNNQAPGIYASTLTYICTGSF